MIGFPSNGAGGPGTPLAPTRWNPWPLCGQLPLSGRESGMCVDGCHSRGVRGFPGREEHVLKCRRFAAPVRGPAPGSWGHHVPRRTRGMGARGMGGGTDLPPLGGKSSVQDRVRPWSPTHSTQRGGPDPASPDSAGREAHVEAPSPAAPDTPASSSVRALHWGRGTAGHARAPGPAETAPASARAGVRPSAGAGLTETLGGSLVCLLLTGARF